jgi:hypothetical protein
MVEKRPQLRWTGAKHRQQQRRLCELRQRLRVTEDDSSPRRGDDGEGDASVVLHAVDEDRQRRRRCGGDQKKGRWRYLLTDENPAALDSSVFGDWRRTERTTATFGRHAIRTGWVLYPTPGPQGRAAQASE